MLEINTSSGMHQLLRTCKHQQQIHHPPPAYENSLYHLYWIFSLIFAYFWNKQERELYEYIIIEGEFVHKQTGDLLDTDDQIPGSKWIFVMSASNKLYAGEVSSVSEMKRVKSSKTEWFSLVFMISEKERNVSPFQLPSRRCNSSSWKTRCTMWKAQGVVV